MIHTGSQYITEAGCNKWDSRNIYRALMPDWLLLAVTSPPLTTLAG